jgi:hypothetical protein
MPKRRRTATRMSAQQVEKVLKQARQAVATGRVRLAPSVPQPGGVKVRGFAGKHIGLVFSWDRPGIGFGELILSVNGHGRFAVDREGMTIQFALDVMRQALEEAGRL